MLVIYDSLTGNVKRFVDKLGVPAIRLEPDLIVNESFILITYTIGFGQVPEKTQSFLEKNHEHLKAVASSGNRNWGNNFAKSADVISQKYNVPILLKFELHGTKGDVISFNERVLEL